MSIPLPDGSQEEIAQLPVSKTNKMLGVWSLPDESDAKHLQEVVVGKTRAWANLPTHLAWKSYRFQLWPGTGYGISMLANQSKKIEDVLHRLEFEMLSFLGVN
jgi:hypothetical protein